ncbi:MAG: epoxyqueuosine reductase QueH [Lachnospiraceae bacterium]|nr:epoxyqueuosine reductase QueH [Lachnospiraceae bacterium]
MPEGGKKTDTILLHSCCAPCSSYCLLYLTRSYRVTVFYDNPNITDLQEYEKRVAEQVRLIEIYNRYAGEAASHAKESGEDGIGIRDRLMAKMEKLDSDRFRKHPDLAVWIAEQLAFPRCEIGFVKGAYEPERFYEIANGLEDSSERGPRCHKCYRLRLEDTAKAAAGFDYFATTLTLSPLKDAKAINRIGEEIAPLYDAAYLATDFKKNNGYLLSILLSELFGLYRQNYCGCEFSKNNTAKTTD